MSTGIIIMLLGIAAMLFILVLATTNIGGGVETVGLRLKLEKEMLQEMDISANRLKKKGVEVLGNINNQLERLIRLKKMEMQMMLNKDPHILRQMTPEENEFCLHIDQI